LPGSISRTATAITASGTTTSSQAMIDAKKARQAENSWASARHFHLVMLDQVTSTPAGTPMTTAASSPLSTPVPPGATFR
jgi:hypothetical protein